MRAPGDEEKELQKVTPWKRDKDLDQAGLSCQNDRRNHRCSCGGWRTVATETTIGPHRAIGDVIARVCGGSMLFLQLFAPSSLRSRQRGASQS
ncbi:uncharacterized protein LOC129604645 [Betta splendens]|uniref:Uncharacterized protein LOC129604627 isoform X2 n=1 Tax=Betta splendens TaxID=158456 RepID=A0A9W2Y242_BETSP|nr:uncharacterized protein LOC129604627 isoform X2 [Betta splendens]XP_055367930.1 uncharacterized protein LOC129604640 isoform X2 [Betta splendens]XP_055367949.1 uncharacterized protein LOC129604645 [Betta splendens]